MTVPHTATQYTQFNSELAHITCPITLDRGRDIRDLGCFLGPDGQPRTIVDVNALIRWTRQNHTYPHNRQPADYNPAHIDVLGLTGRYRRPMPLPAQVKAVCFFYR